MNWTKELPDVSGWYWMHLDFGLTVIEYIYEEEFAPFSMYVGADGDNSALEEYIKFKPMFYGPLEKPAMILNAN